MESTQDEVSHEHDHDEPDASVDADDVKKSDEEEAQKEMAKLHTFFHPSNAAVRSICFKKLIQTIAVLVVALTVYLIVLFASQWNTVKFWGNLLCIVSNQDSAGAYSSVIGSALSVGIPGKGAFNWRVNSASQSYAEALNSVDSGDSWLNVYIPSGFSANLANAMNSSINTGSYAYSNPVYVILDEGRQSTLAATFRSYYNILLPAANAYLGNLTARQVADSQLNLSALADLTFLSKPIQFSEVNLHPVATSGLNLATGFAFTMLLVFSSLLANSLPAMVAHAAQHVWMRSLLWIRIVGGIFIPGILALVPAIVVAAAANNPSNESAVFCKNFGAYWALLWLTMCVFVAVVVLTNYMGAPGAPALVIFMMLNIASSDVLVPLDLSPSFFLIGYGLPMYNAVAASRTIIFCSYDRLGQNIGVLIAWFFASKFLNQWFARRHDIVLTIRKQQQFRKFRKLEMKRLQQTAV